VQGNEGRHDDALLVTELAAILRVIRATSGRRRRTHMKRVSWPSRVSISGVSDTTLSRG